MANLGPGTDNALGLIALAGEPDIPVVPGDTVAINSQNTALIPANWRDEGNSMLNLSLPQNPNPPLNQDAVQFIIETLTNADKPIRIVVLGPLTNIGLALQQAPNIVEKIESVYIMGGAVNVPGNIHSSGVGDNTVAEWNIFLDPEAAEIVFRSGVNIYLASLDVTNQAPVTMAFYNRFSSDHTTPEADFVYGIISWLIDANYGFYFWDPLAAAIATDRNIVTTQTYLLRVVLTEGNENGWTKINPVNGGEIEVCQELELIAYEDLFLDVLNGRK
nr:nucleoside hydrolase [Bacteroidota bacterium]